jgi:hypothetical protein
MQTMSSHDEPPRKTCRVDYECELNDDKSSTADVDGRAEVGICGSLLIGRPAALGVISAGAGVDVGELQQAKRQDSAR